MNIPTLSVEQMRKVDDLAVNHFGVEIIQMMETAGRMVASQARDMVGIKGRIITILAGKGHNGGDGLVAARYLSTWGAKLYVILLEHPDDLKPLVRDHYGTMRSMHINRMTPTEEMQWELVMKESTLLIDALLGYNLKGDPRGRYATVIDLANKSGRKILSVDCPSGLDSDSGVAGSPCIQATQTLALTLPKQGLLRADGPQKSGKVFVADMGVPHEVYDLMGLQVPKLFEKKGIVKL